MRFKPDLLRGVDGLIAMFALHPVRCVFCWRRYYSFSSRDGS